MTTPDALAVLWREAVPVPPPPAEVAEHAALMGWLPDRPYLPPVPIPALPPARD
jgi:hypothetical protein